MNNEAIPKELLEKARRVTCRRIAAAVVQCMADTDTSFTEMAVRLDRKEETVRGWLTKLTDGESIDLDSVSDMMTAMGAELAYSIQRRKE